MGSRYSKASTARVRWTTTATLFALLLAATLLLASGVQAQEPTTEQTVETTTSETEAEGTTSQTVEGTMATKEQDPAGETTAPATENEDPVAQAQDTSDEPKLEAQGSGQQTQAQADTTEDDGTQATTRATPQGRTATITDNDGDPDVDRITVLISNCDVDDDEAYLVVEDGNQRVERFNDGDNAEIRPDGGQLIVRVTGDIRDNFGVEGTDPDGSVLRSSGITCGRDNDNDDNDNDGDDNNGDGNAGNDDLNCDELLRRFRDGGGQYGDGALFADVDVRNQIIICLEQEVEQNTATAGKLPKTGGPSLIGLAVLGVAFAVAGTALVRGRREE